MDAGVVAAPIDASAENKVHNDVMLFNYWTYDDVQINDISVEDYITATTSKHPVYMPHTAGRYQAKHFRKAQCPIVERLTNSLMMHGRNNGKKLMVVRIIKLMEIIHLLTDQNPIQVIVDAVINSGPREDATRIGSAGVVRRQAVDISPLRRVNQAIYLLTTGARESAFRNIKTIAECLADELSMLPRVLQTAMRLKRRMRLRGLPRPTIEEVDIGVYKTAKDLVACGFFQWYDPEFPGQSKVIILGLQKDKMELEAELKKKKNLRCCLLLVYVSMCIFGYSYARKYCVI
ncbi:PREDICTED: 40S ribosomal protein S5-like [Nicotiana attenuata]|uniref:40S ribosomal protein S5-like n=1 Tax=Nicotiana attenuata TaxID=49451 RepID=UPI0009058D20|nr:PREDICTED: 40S ribosomal protein S5-like [Nicotiana attenuata]